MAFLKIHNYLARYGFLTSPIAKCDFQTSSLLFYRPRHLTQIDQNFLTWKIVAVPKIECHQNSVGIWKVTKTLLRQKRDFFSKTHILKKCMVNHINFYIFKSAFVNNDTASTGKTTPNCVFVGHFLKVSSFVLH